jgi:hypothetical protein
MANLSTLLGGGGLQSKPVLHVQDVKAGDVGGGFVDAADTYYTRDINRIVKNSITGATLTNDGTTSGTVGAVGTQTIVNNQSGVHVNSTYVTLPAGDYYYEISHYLDSNNSYDSTLLYDKTAAADLAYSGVTDYDASSGAGNLIRKGSGYFSLSTSSNVDVRIAATSTQPTASAMGHGSLGSSNKVCYLDLKIYKL